MDDQYSRILSRMWHRSVGTRNGDVSTLENPLPSTSRQGLQPSQPAMVDDTRGTTTPTTTVSTATAASCNAATTNAYQRPVATPSFTWTSPGVQPSVYADASLHGGEQVTASQQHVPTQHVPTQHADSSQWGLGAQWNDPLWANTVPSYLGQYGSLVSYHNTHTGLRPLWSICMVVYRVAEDVFAQWGNKEKAG